MLHGEHNAALEWLAGRFIRANNVSYRSNSSHRLADRCNISANFREYFKFSFKLNAMGMNGLFYFTSYALKFFIESPSVGFQNSACPYLPKPRT